MKLHVLSAVFFSCLSFSGLNGIRQTNHQTGQTIANNQNIHDFAVHRLSGGRVLVAWHTEGEPAQIRFEVMRQYRKGQFVSLGIISPKSIDGGSIAYSFIDENNLPESSFYRLKKTNSDSVIFYSMAKEVKGLSKER